MVIVLHRPEYYGLLQSTDGFMDYRGKAEVIISKHRKGATGIVMMDFMGEFTRFSNPEDKIIGNNPTAGGVIVGSVINGENNPPGNFDNIRKDPFILPPPDEMPTPF